MIRLKNILKEVEDDEKYKKMGYSWQRPDGTFKPIKYSHGSDAWQMIGKPENTDSVNELWKKGWNRIWYNPHTLFCHNELMPPNEKQKTALINLAQLLEKQEVEFDAGEGSKILWSIHDTLEESIDRNKPPRGYKVTTPVVSKEGGTKWYDCMVWKDGQVILRTSMTMFERKEDAYAIGVRRAWDIYEGKTQWT